MRETGVRKMKNKIYGIKRIKRKIRNQARDMLDKSGVRYTDQDVRDLTTQIIIKMEQKDGTK